MKTFFFQGHRLPLTFNQLPVHLRQYIRWFKIREESTDTIMNRSLDFFLFQTFTGMAYGDAKAFDYSQHVVTIEGKSYIDGHRIKTDSEFVTPTLPITQ